MNGIPPDELKFMASEARDAYGTGGWAADILERQLAVVEKNPRQYPDVAPAHVRALIRILRGGASREMREWLMVNGRLNHGEMEDTEK